MDEIRCRLGVGMKDVRPKAFHVKQTVIDDFSRWAGRRRKWRIIFARRSNDMTQTRYASNLDDVRLAKQNEKCHRLECNRSNGQNCVGRLLLTRILRSKYLGGRQIVPFVSEQMHLTVRNRMVSIWSENDLLLRCCEHNLSSTSLLAWQPGRSAGVETQNKYWNHESVMRIVGLWTTPFSLD